MDPADRHVQAAILLEIMIRLIDEIGHGFSYFVAFECNGPLV